MRPSLVFFFASSVAAIALASACKEDVKPAVSDGPGNIGQVGKGTGDTSDGGDAGAATTFASFPGFNPTGLAADGDTLYVTLVPVDTTQSAEVVTVDAAGTITVLVNNAVAPSAPTVSSGALYYVDTPAGVTASAILSLNLSNVSAGPTVLVSGVSQPSTLVVYGSAILVASSSGGVGVQIDSVPIAGGTANPISSEPGEYSPGGLATDGANVYFAARATGGGQIISTPLSGGVANSIWAGSDTGTLGAVVAANGAVYFALTTDPNGLIYSVPTLGGLATTVVTGLTQPSAIAVNETYVYYTNNSASGGIYRASLAPDSGIAAAQIAAVSDPAFLVLGATAVYATTDQAIVRVTQ